MRAVTVTQNGGAENLRLSDIDAPTPGPGEVAVAVDTAGVNYLDIYQRNGAAQAPFVAGVEGVGRVTAAGSNVAPSLVGRRVGWLAGQGSFADVVAVEATKVVEIPDDISTDDAVALLMQGITAHYLAISAFKITKDATVLVHSAAGGVGRLLTQVAHHLGATVIATASTPAKREIATAAGADHAVGYEDFEGAVRDITGGRGVDVIYDGVGRDTVGGDLNSLAVRGTLVVIGATSGQPPAVEFSTLAAKSLSVIRPSVAHFTARPGELVWRAKEVFEWAREGVISVQVAGRYPLTDVARAQHDLASRSQAGKLLIQIASAARA